uniref:SHSP domain-containing protein n=1 Tax=Panagrellus redivivus TaxID=6233 RepID=A0A7E4VC72_PANRE
MHAFGRRRSITSTRGNGPLSMAMASLRGWGDATDKNGRKTQSRTCRKSFATIHPIEQIGCSSKKVKNVFRQQVSIDPSIRQGHPVDWSPIDDDGVLEVVMPQGA